LTSLIAVDKARQNIPRLRPPDEIKKRVTGDISKLNQRLLRVSRTLEREAAKHAAIRTVPGRILISFFGKAVNTFEAIEALKRKRLNEEAWVLLRVLLETHVNMVYFLTRDPRDMVYRYLDGSLLDKMKHLREVNFYAGTPMDSSFDKNEWEKRESEILPLRLRFPPETWVHRDVVRTAREGRRNGGDVQILLPDRVSECPCLRSCRDPGIRNRLSWTASGTMAVAKGPSRATRSKSEHTAWPPCLLC
jgi:hypothetical protein